MSQTHVNLEDPKLASKEKNLTKSVQRIPHSSLVLALITMAQFMVILDFTIVQIALPTIGRELGVSIDGLQWIVTAYGLTLAGFLLLSGRAGDLYGHKRLFVFGLVLFSLASLAGGLAPSEIVLISARAVQGLGAAIGSATGLSILVATFPEGRERNRALSVFAAVMGSAFAAGMVSGGFITATLGWRWVFDINVPIGIVAALLSLKYVPRGLHSVRKGNAHLDFPGAVSVTAGLMLFVYALTSLQNVGLTLQTLVFLGLSTIVLGGFIAIERRSKAPLIPLGYLRTRSVFTANAIALFAVAAYVGAIFILTIYMQEVLGYSALYAGLAFAPMGLAFLTASGFLSARLSSRFGVRKVLVFGMILEALGYMLLTQISVSENYLTQLLGPMIILASGTGLAFTAINLAALSDTRRGEEGLASGLINTSRQIGGPIGLAILITVASFWTHDPAGSLLQAQALVSGFAHAFIATSVLASAGALLALFIKSDR